MSDVMTRAAAKTLLLNAADNLQVLFRDLPVYVAAKIA